eukprot:TRINITY_DN12286_c0_g2_i2.p1 TRINITY_DN12286_c0_g2~~TRINITY_DN12286_c0_g2_i2.p1  ORF type:complete len:157 (+),score=20.81 TRINITY_DN12286_c0_g2_i2:68-538(+)
MPQLTPALIRVQESLHGLMVRQSHDGHNAIPAEDFIRSISGRLNTAPDKKNDPLTDSQVLFPEKLYPPFGPFTRCVFPPCCLLLLGAWYLDGLEGVPETPALSSFEPPSLESIAEMHAYKNKGELKAAFLSTTLRLQWTRERWNMWCARHAKKSKT